MHSLELSLEMMPLTVYQMDHGLEQSQMIFPGYMSHLSEFYIPIDSRCLILIQAVSSRTLPDMNDQANFSHSQKKSSSSDILLSKQLSANVLEVLNKAIVKEFNTNTFEHERSAIQSTNRIFNSKMCHNNILASSLSPLDVYPSSAVTCIDQFMDGLMREESKGNSPFTFPDGVFPFHMNLRTGIEQTGIHLQS
ncbi:hypothetical protein BDB01DRAFT_832087 [Pilobolus umbonatus]|nr:hypothetical protein BDB01DRAFT_832087 [Pilobolus umbonatus]